MEGKKLKRKCLKWRILKNISLILALSMIVSSAAGIWYFQNVVRTQKISDEKSRLVQLSNQMEFLTEDMEQFSRSILIDEELQRLLKEREITSEFERCRRHDKVGFRLSFYSNLRPYIMGAILDMRDGSCYGSNYNAMDIGYIREKLKKEEISKNQGRSYVYSAPYYDKESYGDSAMICYQVQMFDKYRFGQRKGTLYIEICFDYFLEQISAYTQKKDYVALVGTEGEFLYKQGTDDKLEKSLAQCGTDLKELVKTKYGYLLSESVGKTEWKLCVLVTQKDLWAEGRFVLVFFLLSFLLSLFLILIFISKRMEAVVSPLTHLSEKMVCTEYGKIEKVEIMHTGDEIETLYECFCTMMDQLRKGEEDHIRYERQKREMEYDIMLSQINPHYLYNVLNTVVYLSAAGRNKDVAKIVQALIHTLHDTLKLGEDNVETIIKKELELTRCYLEIQKYRYAEQFEVRIECGDLCERCKVPKTIIQPLVENAIVHGILPAERKGIVLIQISRQEDSLCISVEDDGVGIQKEEIERLMAGEEIVQKKGERKHIGLTNIRDRIHYLYGQSYGIQAERKEDGGTRIFLRLPYEFITEEEEERR
ncbi:MAG: histidine kinase [Lachnospiraceae bacterium]|nr:histidine kinase [Lachnospiraceae bacterium]